MPTWADLITVPGRAFVYSSPTTLMISGSPGLSAFSLVTTPILIFFAVSWAAPGCCARAASGQATAPPSVRMNPRRRIWIAMRPSRRDHATGGQYHSRPTALRDFTPAYAIADIAARLSDVCFTPQKRTLKLSRVMSALCQRRTSRIRSARALSPASSPSVDKAAVRDRRKLFVVAPAAAPAADAAVAAVVAGAAAPAAGAAVAAVVAGAAAVAAVAADVAAPAAVAAVAVAAVAAVVADAAAAAAADAAVAAVVAGAAAP